MNGCPALPASTWRERLLGTEESTAPPLMEILWLRALPTSSEETPPLPRGSLAENGSYPSSHGKGFEQCLLPSRLV